MNEQADANIETMSRRAGFIYLLHWYDNHGRVEHYVGWTSDLEARLKSHYRDSGGCPTTRKYRRAGMHARLARLWQETIWGERMLQQTLEFPQDCPICCGKMIVNVACEGWGTAEAAPIGPLKPWNRGSR